MASKETKQPKRFAHAKAGKSPMKLGGSGGSAQAKSSAKFSSPNASPLKLEPDNEKNKSVKKGRK
jgi:hypothetical protein